MTKMKKKSKLIAILLTVFISVGLISACANDSRVYDYNDSWGFATTDIAMEAPAAAAPMPMMMPEMEVWEEDAGFAMNTRVGLAAGDGIITDDFNYGQLQTLTPEMPVQPTPPETGAGDGFAEKIIYTASADIETLEFDATIEAVYQMIEANNAFIESSNVGGRNHWQVRNNQLSYRTAWFTIRVPVERLDIMADKLDALGNVISLSKFADNITAQFVDTEARLTTLRIQEERLLYMLTKAEDVSDMIIIEQSLGEVRYQIESIVSTLRNWENRIRFSTLNLYIMEVHEYTEIDPEEVPYWQQVWEGLKETFANIGLFFMNLLKWFIVNLPILILLIVFITLATIFTVRFIRKKINKPPVLVRPPETSTNPSTDNDKE